MTATRPLPLVGPETESARLRRRDLRSPLRFVDWSLALVAIAIAAFGVLMNYSTSWRQLELAGDDPFFFVRRQVIFVVIGIAVMSSVALVNYRFYRYVARQGYVILIVALAGLFVIGEEVNASTAWYQIGGFQIQPSEFGKVVVIVALAAFAARHEGDIRLRAFVGALMLVAIPAGLIFLQPDLGTAVVYGTVAMGALLLAGAKVRHRSPSWAAVHTCLA